MSLSKNTFVVLSHRFSVDVDEIVAWLLRRDNDGTRRKAYMEALEELEKAAAESSSPEMAAEFKAIRQRIEEAL